MAVCKIKGKEKGMWFEVKCLKELIASPTASEKEKEYAKTLLRAWKKLGVRV